MGVDYSVKLKVGFFLDKKVIIEKTMTEEEQMGYDNDTLLEEVCDKLGLEKVTFGDTYSECMEFFAVITDVDYESSDYAVGIPLEDFAIINKDCEKAEETLDKYGIPHTGATVYALGKIW